MHPYVALIHKEPKCAFGVSFPDFPGCISVGDSLEEARVMAAEALALHLEGLAEDGGAMPEPSSIETVMAERENCDAVAILVDPPRLASKAMRINITLPADVD